MTQAPSPPLDPVTDLMKVLDKFLAAGKKPDDSEIAKLVAEHPALADELRGCFAGLSFVNQPAADQTPFPGALSAGAGSTLGDFRLVRELGRGGMGVVY